MFLALIAIVHAPMTPDYSADAKWPLVRLADADEFGVPYSVCKTMETIADQHAIHWYQYLQKYYPKRDVDVWEAGYIHASQAWRILREIQEADIGKDRKLRRLNWLREWIGEEAYNARRMPPPCPGHLFANEEPRGIK